MVVDTFDPDGNGHVEAQAGDAMDLGIILDEDVDREHSNVTLSGVPEGAILSAGEKNPDGTWTVAASEVEELELRTPTNFEGDVNVEVTLHAAKVDTDNLVFNSSFEENEIVGRGWGVFDEVEGWGTGSGEGIEIQENVAGAAADGDSKVELDSHDFGGDDLGTNSSMYQDVAVEPGQTYNLSVQFSPRPGVAEGSNGIERCTGMVN